MIFCNDDRIIVYPVDRESLSVIKSTENFPYIHLTWLISPESWGHEGEYYKSHNGMIEVVHNYEDKLNDCTAVWIVDSWNDLDFYHYIEPKIKLAKLKGKRIICSRNLTTPEKTFLSGIKIEFFDYSTFKPKICYEHRVREIRSPVIFVMTSNEFCNQFYIETALYAELSNRGYEVLYISSRKECAAFGGQAVPRFIFSGTFTENEKVLAMNHYIYHLEMIHQPDIIIIGVPGSAMTYNHQYSTDFGIIAYEISEAVRPDFAILSSLCRPYDIDYFKGIEDSLLGRLGVRIDVHSLSPYAPDFNNPFGEKKLSYLSLDDAYVRGMIEQTAYNNLLNLNEMDGISTAVDRLVDKLSVDVNSIIA